MLAPAFRTRRGRGAAGPGNCRMPAIRKRPGTGMAISSSRESHRAFNSGGRAARHITAIGFTGEPVPPGIRSGATTARNDQRSAASQTGTRSSNCR